MDVLGIGTDIVEVARLKRLADKHGQAFLDRVFTPDERAYCDSRKRRWEHYAVRFAAKEAVGKALGTGLGADAGLKEIEIRREITGPPAVQLSGAARETADKLGIREVLLSLSHTDQFALAFVILKGSRPCSPK